MSKRRQAVAVGCFLVVLAAAGCGENAERNADSAAAAAADTITRFLKSDVVTPGLPADEQLAKVRSWLADPPPEAMSAIGRPEWRTLASTAQQIEIVVYEYGQHVLLQGPQLAWGFACRRYTVDAADQLKAESIACPNGLPRKPPIGS